MKSFLLFLLLTAITSAEQPPYLTYNNLPMGKVEAPLILRTFMPKADLTDEVLTNHHLGYNSPKYNPSQGKDVPGEYEPITGLPAAIGVNHGTTLSYCWDTTECRLLYAWSNGFLNMENYWGNRKQGNRQSFGYVPELVGNLFYKAIKQHPITLNGNPLTKPQFLGFTKNKTSYTFRFKANGQEIQTTITPTEKPNSFHQIIKLIGEGTLGYTPALNTKIQIISPKEIQITLTHPTIKTYQLPKPEILTASDITAANGEKIFNKMACITCHSLDGSKSHGPTLKNLFNSKRQIKGHKQPLTADDSYLRESILNPNAKIVQGFPENYMPAFQLDKNQVEALILYIKTIKGE